MAAKTSGKAPKGGKVTDPRNPKGMRVLVYKNGVRARLEWRPW